MSGRPSIPDGRRQAPDVAYLGPDAGRLLDPAMDPSALTERRRRSRQRRRRRGRVRRGVLLALTFFAAVAAGAAGSQATYEEPTVIATAGPVDIPVLATTTTSTSTTTTTIPDFRALDPGEDVGTMSVTIAASGEEINRRLLADSRSDDERRTQPIDVHDPSLEAGFMLDAAWGFPQLREEYDPTTGAAVMSIIAVHRNTTVPDVNGNSTTMHNIDQIAAGDQIEVELHDGSRQVWVATGDHEFLPADETFGELAISLQTETPRLLMYACDSTEGVPDPSSGTYVPDLRRFVLFELQSEIDA